MCYLIFILGTQSLLKVAVLNCWVFIFRMILNGIPKLTICVKVLPTNYLLRQLKRCNIPVADLRTVYLQYLRPTLEYASPAWFSGLTKSQKDCLKKLQKKAFRVILGDNHFYTQSYKDTCQLIDIPPWLIGWKNYPLVLVPPSSTPPCTETGSLQQETTT